MKSKATKHQVLFVDDDTVFLGTIRDLFGALSAGSWQIHIAAAADQALEILKANKMDLVVVDINMPVLDGVQFLGVLNRRFPNLKKAVLTGHASEERRATSLSNGAELFIEKPQTAEGLKSIFAMLDELVSWVPQDGFQGVLRRVGLQDVIQMECLGRNSSVLEVYNESVLGRIYIQDGSIIHAAGGELVGEPALQKLLALSGGSFELVPFEAPPEHSLHGPWEFLLMEAARMRDEQAAQNATAPPAAEAESSLPALSGPVGDSTVTIAETLVCTGEGELLYESQCADVPARVALLQQVALQAAALGRLLPLGNFDRLDLQLADGRIIAQASADRMVCVRVADGTRQP